MCWANSHQSNALLVVHDVDMIVFARLRLHGPAVMFEGAIDVMRDFNVSVLLSYKLLHSLTRCVVEILRIERRLRACGLRAVNLHLIAVIPLEMA